MRLSVKAPESKRKSLQLEDAKQETVFKAIDSAGNLDELKLVLKQIFNATLFTDR